MNGPTTKAQLPRLDHQFPEIAPGELAALIDASGNSQPLSPRETLGEAAALDPSALERLVDLGYLESNDELSRATLNPHFAGLADILRDPSCSLTLRLWSESNDCAETTLFFPGSLAQGRGVILLSSEQGEVILSGFADTRHVVALCGPVLSGSSSLESDAVDPPFEALLDFDSAMALTVAVDVALLEGRESTPKEFTANELFEHLDTRWGFSGFGELLTHAMTSIMAGEPPSREAFSAAVNSLAEAQLFAQANDGKLRLSDSFLPVARKLSQPTAGISWQRVAAVSDVELERSAASLMLIDGGALRMVPGHPGYLYLERGGFAMIRDFIASELAAFPAKSPPPEKTPSKASPPPVPGEQQEGELSQKKTPPPMPRGDSATATSSNPNPSGSSPPPLPEQGDQG
ncbi:MAG: hypothetical protein AAGA96_02760 [Verrucomicrobiota bacterium]